MNPKAERQDRSGEGTLKTGERALRGLAATFFLILVSEKLTKVVKTIMGAPADVMPRYRMAVANADE